MYPFNVLGNVSRPVPDVAHDLYDKTSTLSSLGRQPYSFSGSHKSLKPRGAALASGTAPDCAYAYWCRQHNLHLLERQGTTGTWSAA